MARVSIIFIFEGMRFAPGQLTAELLRDGHEPQIIFFKKQERLASNKLTSRRDEFDLCDSPSTSYEMSTGNCETYEWGLYKKTKPHELNHLKTCLKEFNPDVIGISSLSVGMTLGEEVIAFLRQHFSQPIVWGGVGATVEPDRAIRSADIVCVGEGEEVIREIAQRVDLGQSLDTIHGTWVRNQNGEITRHPKRAIGSLDAIAIPVYDPKYCVQILGPHFIYGADDVLTNSKRGIYMIMTQRGCPFSCSFCVESFYQDTFGKKGSLRRRSPDLVLEELRIAKAKGYRGISFFDDVFTVNPRWLSEFLPRYKAEIGLPFWCYTYPTTHNPEILKMLVDAGCNSITMGIQSGSERILTGLYDRDTKISRVLQAAQEIVDAGFAKCSFDMIPRTEADREEDLQKTLDLMLALPLEMQVVTFGKLTAFPNFALNERYQNPEILAASEHIPESLYMYYFKLFYLSRSTAIPRETLLEIIQDPQYRADHSLLNHYLADHRSDVHYEPV